MPSSKGNRGRNNRKSKSSKTSRKATRRSVDPSSSNTSGSSSPLMHFSPPMALNTTHIFKVQSRKRDRRNALKESIRRLYHNAYPSWIEIPRRYDRKEGKGDPLHTGGAKKEGATITMELSRVIQRDSVGSFTRKSYRKNKGTTIIVKRNSSRKNKHEENSFVGITWGRQQSQLLVPSMVIDMLLQNKIPAVRFMSSASDINQIFAATNISISIRITNRTVNRLNKKTLVYEWLEAKIKEPINKGVKIVELTVGTEPFSNALYVPKYDVVDSISMMRDVLDEMDLGHVTTTIGHGVDVFNISKVPSESGLHDDIKGMMLKLLEFFNKTGSPFVVNMFPLQTVRDVMNYPIEFTFFDNMSNLTITDGNATYTNAVELIYDSVESGIINAGYPNMKIVIGEIGWPTDGYPDAYIKNAERFNKGLLKFIASKQGTPLRPRPIEAYLHSLSDENKFLTTFGAYQRH
ncbi:putative glucan endo-1,3-beta-glucosidase 8-like [Capsicum annuum]|nr:putative glucan endo-1,3-beta-glucosidase 8-like [Capsicum annuum]